MGPDVDGARVAGEHELPHAEEGFLHAGMQNDAGASVVPERAHADEAGVPEPGPVGRPAAVQGSSFVRDAVRADHDVVRDVGPLLLVLVELLNRSYPGRAPLMIVVVVALITAVVYGQALQ